MDSFGAIGDGKTDDSPAFNKLKSTYGVNPITVCLDKSYRIASNIDLSSNFQLVGINGAKVIPDNNILFNAANMKNIDIETPFHGYYTDGTQSNLKAEGITINAGNYGYLLNNNAKGSNLDLIHSNIKANADAIEINTTAGNFYGIKIIGNLLNALGDSTDPNAGFAVGIAKGKDIIVLGNYVEHSRNEALHIEDSQERIVVTSNIFDNCHLDGARILNNTGAKPVIVSNNHFKKENSTHTNNGIWRVSDQRGDLADNVLIGNVIEGFDTGLRIDGSSSNNVDGTTVIDCNTAISAGVSQVHGIITAKNCPTLVSGGQYAKVDRIISETTPTTILQSTDTKGISLGGFRFPIPSATSVANGYTNIPLFNLPTYFKGDIKACFTGDTYNYFYCYFTDVVYDNKKLTVGGNHTESSGDLGGMNLTLDSAVTQLLLNYYCASARNVSLSVEFNGEFFKKN